MKKLKRILQSKYLFKFLALVFVIGSFLFTRFYCFESKYNESDKVFIGEVTKIRTTSSKLTLEIKGREKLIINYQFKEGQKLDNLAYGDKILVRGNLVEPTKNTIPNSFDYKKYLYNKKIYYIVEADKINKIENNNNYLYTLKNILYKKINTMKSSSYIKTFILGDNSDISADIKEEYQNIGVSHLFSISSSHIYFISTIICYYLDRITYNKKIKRIIVNVFLIFFLLLLGIIPSLLRAILMYSLSTFNYLFRLNIKKIDIMMLVIILAIIIDPFIIYDIGFIYSYLISLFLIIFTNRIRKKKGINKVIYTTLISFFASLPITIYNSYEINIISILVNVLLIPIVSTIIFPLSIIALILPFLDSFLYQLISLLENFTIFISSIEITIISFPKPNIIIIIIYYIILLITLHKPKLSYLLLITILIIKASPYLDGDTNIVAFDVGQADCLLIQFPYNKKNILIDTGNNYSEYKIKNIINYLKSKGISKINYLVISHGDYDHIGGSFYLVNNFKVENVIFNRGKFNDLEKKLITVLEKRNIKYFQNIKELNLNNNRLYFLNNKLYDDENDNSTIIYTEISGIKILLMGDAEMEVERYILEKYNLKNIDILKVGHHGSRTSSHKEFINSINPKYSIISVGKNNRYGHPNKEVLNNLNNSKIYRTDLDGSIMFKIKKDRLKIETCMP